MKIVVIGYSGCGKSTLAKRLGELYRCQVLYLDKVHWLPGWQEREKAEEQNLVNHFMDTHTSWIIDGNYSHVSYERRMEEADQIVFLNFNRCVCMIRALRRYQNNKGKTRDSMADGCLEKIDFEFLSWILYKGRGQKYKKNYQNVITKYVDKVIIIKNQNQLNSFIKIMRRI